MERYLKTDLVFSEFASHHKPWLARSVGSTAEENKSLRVSKKSTETLESYIYDLIILELLTWRPCPSQLHGRLDPVGGVSGEAGQHPGTQATQQVVAGGAGLLACRWWNVSLV